MAAAFSIRAYAESMRDRTAAELGPFAFAAKDLPPMEVRLFRWWEDELAAIKASEAEDEEEAALGKARAPKKRSISDLFAEVPPVDPSASSGPAQVCEDDEVLGSIMRRTKELRRRRRVEAVAAAAAVTAAEEVEPSAGETRERNSNSSRQKALGETNLQDEMGTPGSSEEPETEQNISSVQKDVPDPKEKKKGKISSLQKNKADKLKYIESKKAIKVGKQRDLEKLLPLHSILKKYTKHTCVKMVKEKNRNPKHAGVIELCRKSVKRVKFSEANDVFGSSKQSSKIPQLESLCKLFSDAMTSSSSSTDMSSEGDRHIAAESSSSYMPEKTFTKAKKANENTDHENHCNVSNTGSSGLFDLNQALPESTELNDPHISNSERPNLGHTQDGTLSIDEQVLHNGRENQKRATDLDIRAKGKSPYTLPNHTVHDSVQLQQSWCSMTLHHGVSQLSTGGELPSSQFREFNLSHSTKPNFHSEMNVQKEHWPAAGHTFRLMGKDLTVSTTRVSYSTETSQKHTGPSDKDNPSAKMVLGLPRQGQPFLSLQAPNIPIVSVNTASTIRDSANPASKIQSQFGYRTPHNFSQPLPTANLFFVDQSPYEDRFRNSANSESCRNVLLGYPPPSNHGSEAFLQNSRAPRHYHSDHSKSPSEPFVLAIARHVTPSSDYRANLSQPYGVYSAGSSVHSHNYMNFTLSNPDQTVQGHPDSRVSSALPSRYGGTGVPRAVPENSNASSSSRNVLRSGPVKLSAGAKHILIPNESTVDDNAAPLYSCVSFSSSNRNVTAPRGKGVDFRKF